MTGHDETPRVDDDPGTPGGTADRPARFFRDAAEFGAWLARHHDTETELWMGLNKVHVPERGLVWEDAVPEALCWGWIDSQVQRIDDDAVRQRWTPRKRTSNWSRVNLELVERLTAEGRMQPPGLAIHAARRREPAPYSFEAGRELALPPAYEARLAASPPAAAFWEAATDGYRRACVTWVMTAKQETTRERRLETLVADCAAGRLIAPQRYGGAPAWLARAAAAAGAAAGAAVTDGT